MGITANIIPAQVEAECKYHSIFWICLWVLLPTNGQRRWERYSNCFLPITTIVKSLFMATNGDFSNSCYLKGFTSIDLKSICNNYQKEKHAHTVCVLTHLVDAFLSHAADQGVFWEMKTASCPLGKVSSQSRIIALMSMSSLQGRGKKTDSMHHTNTLLPKVLFSHTEDMKWHLYKVHVANQRTCTVLLSVVTAKGRVQFIIWT